MGRHQRPAWVAGREGMQEGGSLDPEEAALRRVRSPCPWWCCSGCWGMFLPAFMDIFKLCIFTRSDFGLLFLGKKEITVAVAPPPPTQQ